MIKKNIYKKFCLETSWPVDRKDSWFGFKFKTFNLIRFETFFIYTIYQLYWKLYIIFIKCWIKALVFVRQEIPLRNTVRLYCESFFFLLLCRALRVVVFVLEFWVDRTCRKWTNQWNENANQKRLTMFSVKIYAIR